MNKLSKKVDLLVICKNRTKNARYKVKIKFKFKKKVASQVTPMMPRI
jgi:hypothetical protein